MSNLTKFAQNELNIILDKCETSEDENIQKAINDDIMAIVNIFSSQQHTGFTADYALKRINRLLRYLPLSPLTGEDDEWEKLEYDVLTCYQNKRCPAVFKDENGRAYYTEAKIFSDDNGHTWYTCKDSSEYIDFPFDVPTYSEQVIIDNKVERFNIMTDIVNKLKNMGVDIDISDIDEEKALNEMISIDDIKKLQNSLIEDFKIVKPLFDLEENDHIWNVINFVMKSDKEE